MQIRFLKRHNKFQPGDVLNDCFRADALELIGQGIAEEVLSTPSAEFKKHDWKAEAAKEAAAVQPKKEVKQKGE